MAAGLAHELNNPAAAAKRASSELADALEVLGSTIGIFVESGLERAEAEQLVQSQQQDLSACKARASIPQLELADAEDALGDALEDLGVPEAHRVVEPLAQAGVDAEQLQRISALAGPATTAAVQWVPASLPAPQLGARLPQSTPR